MPTRSPFVWRLRLTVLLCLAAVLALSGAAEALVSSVVGSSKISMSRIASPQMYAVTLILEDGSEAKIDCPDDTYILDKAEEDGIVRDPSHNIVVPACCPASSSSLLGDRAAVRLLQACPIPVSSAFAAGLAVLVPCGRLLLLRWQGHCRRGRPVRWLVP